MGDQKGFPVIFAFVSLLSCCQASNFFLPRVSRTDDAIIIDLTGVGYASSFYGKSWYGEIANPGFIAVPSFSPYPMMFRQQQPMLYNGWSGFDRNPSLNIHESVPSMRQFDGEDDEEWTAKSEVEIALRAPATAPKCGGGPTAMPTTRALASGRIAGGADVKKNAWPFMVALKKKAGSSFCSGTLISETQVLLAAQCLESMSAFDLSTVTVLVGMHSTDQSDVQMTRRIGKMFLHSKYNAATYANDIAMIVLDSPVVISRTVAPACLPPANADPDQYVGQDAIILGWGKPDPLTATKVLQQAKVAILSNADCRLDDTFGRYVTDTTTCITSDKNDKFTCVDDVGGPVVTLPSPGTWTVVGINSYTKDCNSNGLKTRVSAYRVWIDLYMNEK